MMHKKMLNVLCILYQIQLVNSSESKNYFHSTHIFDMWFNKQKHNKTLKIKVGDYWVH